VSVCVASDSAAYQKNFVIGDDVVIVAFVLKDDFEFAAGSLALGLPLATDVLADKVAVEYTEQDSC
ncbi:hypothetical protein M8C21_029150, partial [Ambrosia artemisiifolia]